MPSEQPFPRSPLIELSLQDQLHEATRGEHASLNRLIIQRLPLALSQHVHNPYLYTAGMTVFGCIYLGFENSWTKFEWQQNAPCPGQTISGILEINGLRRTERLRNDLRNLRRRLNREESTSLDHLEFQTLHFVDSIRRSIRSHPHLILAYTWAMYLALFNGGRFVVKQLQAADASFWHAQPGEDLTETCLSFWYFDESPKNEDHGFDIKADIKTRLDKASEELTATQRQEVVEEAQKIFQMCRTMITVLDGHAEAQIRPTSAAAHSNWTSYFSLPITHMLQTLKSVATPLVTVVDTLTLSSNSPAR